MMTVMGQCYEVTVSDDEDEASSDNNDDLSLILPPPGFQHVSIPPTNTLLAFFDPAAWQVNNVLGIISSSNGPRISSALVAYP